jgi:hypothetical protein
MIKPRTEMGRACSGGGAYRVLVGKLEGRSLGRLDIYGRIILKWLLENWDGGHRLDQSGSG